MAKILIVTFKCLRCNHDWHPRSNQVPLRCGECKSPYWNKPPKKGTKKKVKGIKKEG